MGWAVSAADETQAIAGAHRAIVLKFQENSLKTETGIVKWFNNDKGFGFIMPELGGKDLFAHYSEIQGSGHKVLEENQRVSYIAAPGTKGPQATKITLL